MIAAAPERVAVATHPNAIGGILIVVGTCIGAGLLALPVSNSPGGFGYSTVVMVFVWAVTTLGALFVLEVTQWLPRGSNIVSIVRATLGRKAEAVAWIVYLLLCYSLLCAYISGGADILGGLTQGLNPGLARPAAAAAFTLVLGSIVLRGIRSLDLVNRGLMLVKLATFALLIFLISPHIDADKLRQGELRLVLSSVSVAVTSFGFAIVIPSLLDYFDGNVKKVRTIILAGSLIPLGCYIAWNTVVMGTLPRMGPDGLQQVLASGDATDGLVRGLKDVLKVPAVTDASELFASICVLTSFLGVSLALFDFLADGLSLNRGTGSGRIKTGSLTFVPPVLIVSLYPEVFILALSYAGLLVVVLSVLLPAAMVWSGRYVTGVAKDYRVWGGKATIMAEVGAGLLILSIGLLEGLGLLKWV